MGQSRRLALVLLLVVGISVGTVHALGSRNSEDQGVPQVTLEYGEYGEDDYESTIASERHYAYDAYDGTTVRTHSVDTPEPHVNAARNPPTLPSRENAAFNKTHFPLFFLSLFFPDRGRVAVRKHRRGAGWGTQRRNVCAPGNACVRRN